MRGFFAAIVAHMGQKADYDTRQPEFVLLYLKTEMNRRISAIFAQVRD